MMKDMKRLQPNPKVLRLYILLIFQNVTRIITELLEVPGKIDIVCQARSSILPVPLVKSEEIKQAEF
jgi:hypothetical protein